MRDGRVPRAKLQDPVGKRFWPFYPGRDGCRTPMPWTADGGFTTGEPWLPMNPDAATRNVAAQAADPGSLLSTWRRLLRLRRESPALRRGAQGPLERRGEVLAWSRQHAGEALLVFLDLGASPSDHALPPGRWEVAFSTARPEGGAHEGSLWLGVEEGLILRRAG